jgi:hypothetical protein
MLILSFSVESKEFIPGLIASVFLFAIFFLVALLIVYPIRKNRSLIAVLVAGSFLVTTFVQFCPAITRKVVSTLYQSQIVIESQYDTFAQQVLAALFRTPDSLVWTIGVGSFLFGLSAAICGLLFWSAAQKRTINGTHPPM